MIRYGLLISLLVVALDQATKLWVVFDVMSPPQIIEVTSFFNIVMVWNKGASFGLFSTDSPWTRYGLAAVAIVITVVMIVWLRKAETRWLATGLGLVIGGAIGNVIDRFAYGAVADFLDFHVAGYHWPSFNAADISICVGVGFLLLDGLIGTSDDTKLET